MGTRLHVARWKPRKKKVILNRAEIKVTSREQKIKTRMLIAGEGGRIICIPLYYWIYKDSTSLALTRPPSLIEVYVVN